MKKIQLYLLSGAIMTSLMFASNTAHAEKRTGRDTNQEELVIHHVFDESKSATQPVLVGRVVVKEGDMMIVRSRDTKNGEGIDYLIDLNSARVTGLDTAEISVGSTVEVFGTLQEILKA